MGQSFLDKHGFYQPIKILLSLIDWFLLQFPGNRWKGGQKKGPEDKGGMAGIGGGTWGTERGSGPGFEAQKAKNMLLGSVPSKLMPFRLLILCTEWGKFYSLVRFIDSKYMFCLCLHILGSDSICYHTFIYFIQHILSSPDYVKGMDTVLKRQPQSLFSAA